MSFWQCADAQECAEEKLAKQKVNRQDIHMHGYLEHHQPLYLYILPVMTIATLHCTEHSLLVIPTDPCILLELAGLWRCVYQTSTPYMNLETTTVLYNCFMPLVDMLLDVLERCHILEDQKVATVRALVC